jgi:hypothetical protein
MLKGDYHRCNSQGIQIKQDQSNENVTKEEGDSYESFQG